MMGAKRIERDRLVSLFVSSDSTDPVEPLLVEAVSEGWWYSLGLPGGKLIVGLIADPRVSRLAGETRRLFFSQMLSEAHKTRDRGITVPADIFLTNAETSRLDRMSGDGWLAIGDAAMSFDPLSSHGLCSAIEQSIEAAQLMEEARPEGFARMDEQRQLLYREYRRRRSLYYMQVERFSSFPFWVNRQTA
jgi:2-polyprenyl-6-methoxyphenol hydroxylase-like FAD-dependent oxidoreductase